MEKNPSLIHKPAPAAPMSPDERLNASFTAIPHDALDEEIEYGDMNEKDARESGYTDAEGHAIARARKDVHGSPTNAFTDIGAGRSSAVKRK